MPLSLGVALEETSNSPENYFLFINEEPGSFDYQHVCICFVWQIRLTKGRTLLWPCFTTSKAGFKGSVQRDGLGWKWYQLIGLPLTKRRPNFRLDLSIPQSVRAIKADAPACTGVGNSLENCQFKIKAHTRHFFTWYSSKQWRDEIF